MKYKEGAATYWYESEIQIPVDEKVASVGTVVWGKDSSEFEVKAIQSNQKLIIKVLRTDKSPKGWSLSDISAQVNFKNIHNSDLRLQIYRNFMYKFYINEKLIKLNNIW